MANTGWTHDAENAILFHIGSIAVHTYSLTMLLGMLTAIGFVWYFWQREGYSSETLLLMVIVVIPSSIIGARIWYVIGRPPTDTNPWYAFWTGGLAIQGGVTFAVLGGCVVAYFHRTMLDMRKLFTLIVPNVLIGQVIGRWGNFANHEVFGQLTSYHSISWLGNWITQNMWFSGGNEGAAVSGYYAPLFLYESMINLFGWILLVWVFQTRSRRKWFKPGTIGGLYFIWYGIVRIIMEPMRNPSDILKWDIFGRDWDASRITGVLFLLVGLSLALFFQFMPNKYKWNQIKYTWEIPVVKLSKRKLNSGTNKRK